MEEKTVVLMYQIESMNLEMLAHGLHCYCRAEPLEQKTITVFFLPLAVTIFCSFLPQNYSQSALLYINFAVEEWQQTHLRFLLTAMNGGLLRSIYKR